MRWDDIECQPAESLWKIVDSWWWLKWVTKLDLNGYRGVKRNQGEEKEVGGWPGGWGVFKIAKLFWSANAIVTYFMGAPSQLINPGGQFSWLSVCRWVWVTGELNISKSQAAGYVLRALYDTGKTSTGKWSLVIIIFELFYFQLSWDERVIAYVMSFIPADFS